MDLLRRAREVRVNFEAIHVADDQQRRVAEVFAVLQQLLVGGDEVFVLPLVLPGEVVLHPDVGPPLFAFKLVDAALERVPGAVGVGCSRRRLAEELAEIEEVLVAGGALGEFRGLPLRDELLRRHEWIQSSSAMGSVMNGSSLAD